MRKFIENMEKTKNVVYTFSNILDFIEKLDNLKNPLLGEISKDSIMELKISDFKSENEFEKNIDQFLNENNKKICLIKFRPNEGSFINYIKFFIENKEKDSLAENKEEQTKKAFIFIFHLSRIYNSDLEDFDNKTKKHQNYINKKILNETISLLSEYYQIFIDNLNGDDNLTLDNILTLKGAQIYEKCLDFDYELNKNIYTSLSLMKYNIPSSLGNLNEKTYVNKLIDFIEKDKELREEINKCIKKQMNNEEDIIVKVFETEFSVSNNDIDMISVIKRYLSNSYTKKLNILYYKAEQDQFFSSLLSTYELNRIIQEKNKNYFKIEIAWYTADYYLNY